MAKKSWLFVYSENIIQIGQDYLDMLHMGELEEGQRVRTIIIFDIFYSGIQARAMYPGWPFHKAVVFASL